MKSYYNDFFEKGQLKIHFNLYQIGLPSDDPVYTLKKILEDLNYTSLLAQYSSKGRKGYNPIMMFAVLLYASMRGVRAVDRIVELCERDIAFIWLTNGLKPKRDAHTYISADRTDYNTLIPTLQKHEKVFAAYPKEVTADSGYCSEKNLVFLKEKDIKSYIKLQTHEKMKTRAYKEDIGKYYNMMYIVEEDTHYYRCYDGRNLEHIRTEISGQGKDTKTMEVYGCADCSGCEHKPRCLYKYDELRDIDKNKIMKINENWEELKEESHENIQSEQGILNRQIRSIQTEGQFGDLKENNHFRRFNYRSAEKVYKEIHAVCNWKKSE
jgi:hypothetical protein